LSYPRIKSCVSNKLFKSGETGNIPNFSKDRDCGYISKDLFEALWSQGTPLVTGIKKNMKNKLLPLWDKLMLRKRNLIETINDQLKNSNQIEHTRHRSPKNFLTNLLAGLIAYQPQSKKPPSLHFTKTEQQLLTEPLLLHA
jgi:hypothetical protein